MLKKPLEKFSSMSRRINTSLGVKNEENINSYSQSNANIEPKSSTIK